MKLLAFDNPFPYNDIVDPSGTNQDKDLIKNIWWIVKEDNWLWKRLFDVFNISKYEGNVFGYVQYVFNIALSIVAFIAVVILIYYFYMVLFSKDQDGIGKSKKALKWVFIAIIAMWLSWIIIRALFWIVKFVQG